MANVAAPVMFKRISRVDEVMRLEGWNLAIVDRLAEELQVDRATVYKLRNRAKRWTQAQMRPADIDAWRAQQMQALTDTSLEARRKGDYAAAVKAIEVQAKIVGTIAPTKVEVGGTVSHVHSAAVERVASLAPEQLEERRRLALEASFSEVAPGAEVVPVPAESD